MAEAEAEEAREIQKRLLQEISEADLDFDRLNKHQETLDSGTSIEKIEVNLDSLTQTEKLDLLRKESPEFFSLIDEYKSSLAEIERTKKLLNYKNVDSLETYRNHPVYLLTRQKYFVLIRYCTHIDYYLLLKASRKSIYNHPVISTLASLKKMVQEIEKLERKIVFRQSLFHFHSTIVKNGRIKCNEKASESEDEAEEYDFRDFDAETNEEPLSKKRKVRFMDEQTENLDVNLPEYGDLKDNAEETESDMDDEDDFNEEQINMPTDQIEDFDAELDEEENQDGDIRRPINYQIAKNKGLTPKKKKELRNPRVKHRMKFKKAKARRRGQVREPRKETTRYSGEFTGIKSSSVRSIRFK